MLPSPRLRRFFGHPNAERFEAGETAARRPSRAVLAAMLMSLAMLAHPAAAKAEPAASQTIEAASERGVSTAHSRYLDEITARMSTAYEKRHPLIYVDGDAVRAAMVEAKLAGSPIDGPEAVKRFVQQRTGAVLTPVTAKYSWDMINQRAFVTAGEMSTWNDMLDQKSPVDKICLLFPNPADTSAREDAIRFMQLDAATLAQLKMTDRPVEISKDAMRRFLDYRAASRCIDYRYTPHPEGRTDMTSLFIYHQSEVFSDVYAALQAARDGHHTIAGQIADYRSVSMHMAKKEVFDEMALMYRTDWIASIIWSSPALRAAQAVINAEGPNMAKWTDTQIEMKAYELTEWDDMKPWKMQTLQRYLEDRDDYLKFLYKEFARSHLPKDKQCKGQGPDCKPVDPMDVKRFHFVMAYLKDFSESTARVAGVTLDGQPIRDMMKKTQAELKAEQEAAKAKAEAQVKLKDIIITACGAPIDATCAARTVADINDKIREGIYVGVEVDVGLREALKDWADVIKVDSDTIKIYVPVGRPGDPKPAPKPASGGVGGLY